MCYVSIAKTLQIRQIALFKLNWWALRRTRIGNPLSTHTVVEWTGLRDVVTLPVA